MPRGRKPTKKDKIAVYFCNGIGNLLLFTPALQALQSLYKNPEITFVIPSEWSDHRKPIIKEIIKTIGHNIIEFPKEEFKPDQYKLLFYTLHNEPSQALTLFKQHKKANQPINPDWLNEYPHEIEYYMQEVYRLGYKQETPQMLIPLGRKPLFRGDTKRIAFYNGAANLSKYYKWERKKWHGFDELAPEVYNYYKCDIIYLGGNGDKKEGQALSNKFPFVTNYAGELSFIESAKALSQCDLLVCSDSSLMHVADALQIPTIVLFGATLYSKNRPYYVKHEIVRGKCPYSPCQYTTRFSSCNDFQCMQNISVGDVMKAIRKIGVIDVNIKA